LLCHAGTPDFNNLLAVLRRELPARPTLFEFFLNDRLYDRLVGDTGTWPKHLRSPLKVAHAFRKTGYDYVTFLCPDFEFPAGEVEQKATRSINEGAVITDRTTFDRYPWPDPRRTDYSVFTDLENHLPPGMKVLVYGPYGVLENVIRLMGYENLCYLILDDDQLVFDVFEAVGTRLVSYYRRCVSFEVVGGIIGNDDWGFKSQTMLSPDQMRSFVFPWHKEIVDAAHEAGKPAILHSCGCLTAVMDDVIDDMKYDAKHSFEDAIESVERAYDRYHSRIAILGGIDLDFVCRSSPEDVYSRSRDMLMRAEGRGGYALGTGNSVPEYVPDENYFAMIAAALENRRF
jgi:uroporphyrinogen decarboxylase